LIDNNRWLLLGFGDRGGAAGFDVQDGLTGGEGLVEEGVAIAAGHAVVAGVVEFDREDGLHRRGAAEQEVDVLAADIVLVSSANNPESTTWISTSFSRPIFCDLDFPSSSLKASCLVVALARSVVQRVCVARWSWF